jgi:hypothetical protein
MCETKSLQSDLAHCQMNDFLRDSVMRMRSGVDVLPFPIRRFFYDGGRAEPRIKQPLGPYPQIAMELARAGASWPVVTGPMNDFRTALWLSEYVTRLPPFDEAQELEQHHEGRLNEIQVVIRKCSPRSMFQEARVRIRAHIAALKTLDAVFAVCERMAA